jgi:hypothetical protein
MIIKEVHTKKELRSFYKIQEEVYRDITYFRNSESDITQLLVEGPSAFHRHATVLPFLILENEKVVGRFAFIQDHHLQEYLQVSFFEAQPGLVDVAGLILEGARSLFPDCKKVVFGLNGHLNYGAGILISHFNEPPVFGLPYNPEYYKEYFRGFDQKTMVSYRFPLDPFVEYHQKMGETQDFKGITVRKLNKKKLRQETEIYTWLNNTCFPGHPYWADRLAEEDFELFNPFRFLIKEENLLFAEKNGKPIGFFLWYPDFNQLIRNKQHLGWKEVLKVHFANPINTFRFTEIAVLPGIQNSYAVQAMILYAIPYIQKTGVTVGEGGFIFEENTKSIVMTRRFLERVTGAKMEPYRRYALFEKIL